VSEAPPTFEGKQGTKACPLRTVRTISLPCLLERCEWWVDDGVSRRCSIPAIAASLQLGGPRWVLPGGKEREPES
jgi:hypothetical protein